MTRTDNNTLNRDETGDLIAADKVVGTAVYDRTGEKAGRIDKVMLEKRGGKVRYAVASFGGFLGMGEDFFAIPWQKLDYDEHAGGYKLNVDIDKLKKGPSSRRSEDMNFDRTFNDRVDTYYGIVY